LAKADRNNAGWQRDLSVSYNKVGDVQVDQGNLTEALQSFRDGLAIRERLAKADPHNTGWQRDLSLSHDRVGDVQKAQGNLTEALQSFRYGFAIAERLAKADTNNAGWQRDLSVSYVKVGDVQEAQGNLAEALQSFRDSLAIAERLAKADRSNARFQSDLQYTVSRIGGLAYRLVLTRDFAKALEAADAAIALAPTEVWLHTIRAHALMFLGRVDEARTLYMKYRDEKNVQDGKSWPTVILEDFAELRQAGQKHPLMDEIETKFNARE
jgi:tetratricopeptide (TPR) repeat protein